ncbi:hypothetical protein PQR34_27655 [Paraburkholderia sediminicola]|uniref:hypothetical protein n=1 Tax=Paraburkholderia sediminicola TaxID=458836 RepID=UPI00105DCEFE
MAKKRLQKALKKAREERHLKNAFKSSSNPLVRGQSWPPAHSRPNAFFSAIIGFVLSGLACAAFSAIQAVRKWFPDSTCVQSKLTS